MDERKHISLIYEYDVNWIGGTYYILNIIKALKFLPDLDKPFLTIYCDHSTSLVDLTRINYPYIEYVKFSSKLNSISMRINQIFSLLTGREMITVRLPSTKIKNFYYRTYKISNSNLVNYYHWHPDFQDLYLPQFFTKTELKRRSAHYKRLVVDKEKIVFSSNSALMDFNKFYPDNTNIKRVLRFVSFQDSEFNLLSIDVLKHKFGVNKNFFIVSNQFWPHKNHIIVLEAFVQILKKYPDFQLIFTGKEHYNNTDSNLKFVNNLKNLVIQNNLAEKILFLGFIDRKEQLKLMKESVAIIQPSLFEGWSTVVEDAKFLNKCIICSDIPVHREQLPNYELFFNPSLKQSLIAIVEKVINSESMFDIGYSHENAIVKFAHDFIELF